jgi:Holliday junction DNA helicase RuvA
LTSAASGIWCFAPVRLLTKVQGVGARVALAILTALEPDDLLQAMAAQDKTALTRASGVGPKLAGRIVIELKDKVGAMALGPLAGLKESGDGAPGAADEAVSALVNLGYSRSDAFRTISQANHNLGGAAPLDELIKAGLKELVS